MSSIRSLPGAAPGVSSRVLFFVATVWAAIALAGCSEDKPKPTTVQRAPAEACASGEECTTGLCVEVAEGRAICTVECDPAAPSACPATPNWRCQPPEQLATAVCACISDSPVEVCADGLDNDCDGLTDDCAVCGNELAGPDDARHCGACFRSCAAGATCVDAECVCADGSVSAECVREPGAPECADAGDCDDGIDCTDDRCSVGQCIHDVNVALCGPGRVCDLLRGGCRTAGPCATDLDCADGDPCTSLERCDPRTRVCVWLPLDGDGDGHPPRVCGGGDCDDSTAATYPGASELCDGVDNGCDGRPDQPLSSDVCSSDRSCDAGRCVCAQGTTECAAGCVDLDSTDAHCGTCDRACPNGAHCEQGACADVDECADGSATCGVHSYCVNGVGGYLCACDEGYARTTNSSLCTDVDECARSTDDCAEAACVNTDGGYRCACPQGYEGDGRTCSDVNECNSVACSGHGQCENAPGTFECLCDPGYVHNGAGACIVVNDCQAGLVPGHRWCNGTCVDVLNDSNNCGACYATCAQSQCLSGSCGCTPGSGQTYCAGRGCVDLRGDAQNCGTCGNDCGTGGFCLQGACFCPTGQKLCNGRCVPLGTTSNCGDCNVQCPSLASCGGAGSCTCPSNVPDVCSATCTNRQTDRSHCGSCGNVCATGASCSNGACACPAGQTVCNGSCVTLDNHPAHCGTCGNACTVACSASSCASARQVGVGSATSCALLSDGRVRCWGASYLLGIGVENYSAIRTPTTVLDLVNVSTLVVGARHACALTGAGELWCWGDNTYYGAVPAAGSAARPVSIGSGYTHVAAGQGFTCAQRGDGRIVCWGDYTRGQRGDGVTNGGAYQVMTGPAANTLANVDRLVAGAAHVCALKAGAVYCWGTQAAEPSGYAAAVFTPTLVAGLSGVTDLASWGGHTCAIQAGSVYCWGFGGEGQLGNGVGRNRSAPTLVPGVSTAVKLTVGDTGSCAKLSDGNVLCWGNNRYGQLGNNTAASTTIPNAQLVGGASFSSLALGANHGCAVTNAGGVSCWGLASDGVTTFNATTYVPNTIVW